MELKKKCLVRGDTAEGELVLGRDLTELSRSRWERDVEDGRGCIVIFRGSLPMRDWIANV